VFSEVHSDQSQRAWNPPAVTLLALLVKQPT
jgi:hypothetical protein